MADDRKFSELLEDFGRKNPDFVRDAASSHFLRIEKMEISQGRISKIGPVEKHYKEDSNCYHNPNKTV